MLNSTMRSKRILISFPEGTYEILEKMIADDNKFGMGFSAYIVNLVIDEYNRREEEKGKRPPGRPRKESGGTADDDEEIDDGIANIPHPMAPGTMLTKEEYKIMVEFYRKKGVDIVKEAPSMQMEMKRN